MLRPAVLRTAIASLARGKPFCQLEQSILYKAHLAGIPVEKILAAYTTKTCHRCGQFHPRKKHVYRCAR